MTDITEMPPIAAANTLVEQAEDYQNTLDELKDWSDEYSFYLIMLAEGMNDERAADTLREAAFRIDAVHQRIEHGDRQMARNA